MSEEHVKETQNEEEVIEEVTDDPTAQIAEEVVKEKKSFKLSTSGAIILGAIIIGVFLMIGLRGVPTGNPQVAGQAQDQEIPEIDLEIDENEHIYGNADARILLVEYSDFDCPFCARLHPVLKSIVDNNKDIAWAYRHFPLDSHPEARPKAEASECVADIAGDEAFWEFNDAIFERATIAEAAERIEFDLSQCDPKADEYAQAVQLDMDRGLQFGIQGTPNTIIYDNKTSKAFSLGGAQPESVFMEVIDTLKKAK